MAFYQSTFRYLGASNKDAPLLYILQAEPMAYGIRQTYNIVDIQLPAIERPLTAKINQ